ncbi:MAG: amino acid permease [Thermoplasmata archaeon]|nr:amino acid permease [Thermoplasmata archaeon]
MAMGEGPPVEGPKLRRAIGPRHAFALYVSSVLGTGILVLPGLAGQIAGPGSLIAWGVLALASLPFAITFASLSARSPESGGVYAFTREALGRGVATSTGWLFGLWALAGVPAVALIAASYVAYAFPLGRPLTFALGFAIVAVAYLINYRGIVLSSRVQLGAIVAVVALLATVVILALPHVRASNFEPFLPNGLLPVGTAASLIFWSFLGYENVSNVAEEFEDPARDFPRAVALSVVVVGAFYFAVAFVTVGTRAYAAGGSVAPFAAILGHALGPYAADGTALLAVGIVFAVVNAYTTGMSRVAFAVACDGGYPSWLAHLDPKTRAPGRALLAILGCSGASFVVFYLVNATLTTALLTASGAAILVYVFGSLSGLRIRPPVGQKGHRPWWPPAISLVLSLIILPFVGPLALVAVGVAAMGYLYSFLRGRRGASVPPGRR